MAREPKQDTTRTAPPASEGPRASRERLLRAEAELEAAIMECQAALDEIRRELRGREVPARRDVVH